MKTVEQNIIKFIRQNNLISPKDNLLVALSGGPDSVFVLEFLLKYKNLFEIDKIIAAHINHKLRGQDSDKNEEFCVDLCRRKNIEFASASVNVKEYSRKSKKSIEEGGRELRYSELQKIAVKYSCNKIVTAHNCDDNTETVLFNLIKGSGLAGISGIPVKRDNLIRPLLSTSKKDILSFLEKYAVPYCIDKTNFDTKYKRNFLRSEIIPKLKEKINPNLDETILRFSTFARSLKVFISSELSKLHRKYVRTGNGNLFLSSLLFQNENPALIGELLKYLLNQQFSFSMENDDYLKLFNLFGNQTGKKIELNSKIFAVRERNGLLVYKDVDKLSFDNITLSIGEKVLINDIKVGISEYSGKIGKYSSTGNIEFISGDNLSDKFLLRPWKKGDSFRPLGLKGTKKISDFLTEQKISSINRKNQLVLVNGKKIVWVIGLRIDDRYKITENTKKVLKLWMK